MGRRRRFARIILIDGPFAAGPWQIGWVTASVVPSGHSRFELTGEAGADLVAVHEYELLPREDGKEQRARWVRLLRVQPRPDAHGTRCAIPLHLGGPPPEEKPAPS